ncbi:dynein assembly factor with WDR repeat domains 1 [Microdochium nivale]|nr:dynein assembly factor with WDR repeat domains 1 [Microdochium nivale]
MRLLKIKEDGSLSLWDHSPEDVPPYAILSHTWGPDDQEITFQDVQNHEGHHKDGYKKLAFCSQQATLDGLNHFWIDTCCIDKSNSQELQEAINSMFRWYRDAEHCYVFLTDVYKNASDDDNRPSQVQWEKAFRSSRWFTRGWTLQEMIAPRSVKFFSAEGEALGNKTQLEALLHECTRIPIDALRGKHLVDFSINDRFSWLGKRKTKRPEDLAYCMFGIFDVHMPLIYSEGQEKAFLRLRREIGGDTISEAAKQCIADLRVTDPRHDKKRIESMKGSLLRDSYIWVLDNPDFRQWCNDGNQRLLWVKGDPGKGKTMLLCGIIDELEKVRTEGRKLSYFLFQATDKRINTATAALRSLIYMLLEEDTSLVSYMEKQHEKGGRNLFEDTNSWQALYEIFENILQDPKLHQVVLVVDALDECLQGLPGFLDLVARTSETTTAKWLVSSRNWPQIEEILREVGHKLSLEVNETSVTEAVNTYIKHKVSELARRKVYHDEIAKQVYSYLSSEANGTFLWVALICQVLEKTRGGNALQKVKSFPPGLDALYQRMMEQILVSEDAKPCTQVLAVMATAYRPPSLPELMTLIGESSDVGTYCESLQEIISLCGSFLIIRQGKVYFVHQSAKDFLMKSQGLVLFPKGQPSVHSYILENSIEAMSSILKRDIYNLRNPGFPIDKVKPPTPDPLSTVGYCSIYWVNHLVDAIMIQDDDRTARDCGIADSFLRKKALYWIEALSLLRGIPDSIGALERLKQGIPDHQSASDLQAIVVDVYRLLRSFRPAIESRPLQCYVSALVFSPAESLVRKRFRGESPCWVKCKPEVSERWSACEATLEGHTGPVESAVFSPDSSRVVSASYDETVKLWDAATGTCEATLEGHSDGVMSAAFSPDGRRVISASYDETVKLWDAATGTYEATLEGHTSGINSAVFSPDGRLIISASDDETVKLWDAATGTCEATLEGHSDGVMSAAFSPDGRRVISASDDKTVKLWDAATGTCEATLEGHSEWVRSAAFSPDGRRVISASDDKTVKLWDAATGTCEATLEGHSDGVISAAFSPDGRRVISASDDKTVKLWDAATGTCEATLEGHSEWVRSAAFSPDGRRVISASDDKTVKLWDAATGTCEVTLKGHTSSINSVAFSPDSRRVISASYDKTVKLWDAAIGTYEVTLEGHTSYINSVAFSPDGCRVISASSDKTVKLWDAATGTCEATLEGHSDWVRSAAFSPDGRRVISASDDKTVKLWDAVTGECKSTYGVAADDSLSWHAPDAYIYTGVRLFPVGNAMQYILDACPNMSFTTRHHRYSVSSDGAWILSDSQPVLWLLPELRSRTVGWATVDAGTKLVIGCSDDRVFILHFTAM